MSTVSAKEAARIAIAAQGIGGRGKAILGTVVELGVLQLDSVNVLCRAHYLPLFSRLGAYDRSALDAAAWAQPRALFEYWGHEASLLPIASQPLFRFRMERAERGVGTWASIARFGIERRSYVDDVLSEVRARGPLRASELTSGEKRPGRWWSRSEAKVALEWLFWTGKVSTATRRHFERVYDVTERVLPPEVLAAPTPREADAHRALLAIAGRALGVATEDDLADYFRLKRREVAPRLDELVEDGTLTRVDVEGWKKPAFLHRDANAKKPKDKATVLAPFDPLVWYRARAERIFGFHYRIEIYTPAPARKHGYYVLPILVGDRLVARVDLKAMRDRGRLMVHASYAEAHADPDAIAGPIATELTRLAGWLGLDGVTIGRRGKLSPAIRRAL